MTAQRGEGRGRGRGRGEEDLTEWRKSGRRTMLGGHGGLLQRGGARRWSARGARVSLPTAAVRDLEREFGIYQARDEGVSIHIHSSSGQASLHATSTNVPVACTWAYMLRMLSGP